MIEARNLTRRYGDFTAVDDISFSVEEGEIVGFLGPNGAGKTTTLRMLTGFLPPTSGHITVAGTDLVTDALSARRQIGYLPENVALYPEMRVSEYLRYRGMLEGMSRAVARQRLGEVVRSCILQDVEQQIIGTLSKGYRQRVGLAAAILHEPKVLVLDEPTVGLDPKQIIAIRDLIRDLGQQQTLLLSSHVLPEVELLCDRVIIVDRGRIVAQGSPQSLRESWEGTSLLRVEMKEIFAEASEILGSIAGIRRVETDPSSSNRLLLDCNAGSDPREEIFRAAVDRGWILLELSQERVSLEDIFVRLTTRDEADFGAELSDQETAP